MRTAHPHVGRLYAASLDWWLAGLGILVMLAELTAIPFLASSHLRLWAMLFAIFCLLIFALYLIDTLFFTAYELTDDGLAIVSQLRRYCIPYEHIRSLRPGGLRGLISGGGLKRFSLSAHCYYLELEDEPWRRISISPRLADTFLAKLSRLSNARSSS